MRNFNHCLSGLLLSQFLALPSQNCHAFSIASMRYKHRISSWTTACNQRYTSPLYLSDGRGNNNPQQDENDKIFEQMDITQEFDAEALEEMEREQPSEWMVMKELLGINIFTFILAGLIIFFLSTNIILGPGWLGSTLGIQGTGNFEEVSPSLPDALDLNKPEYKL